MSISLIIRIIIGLALGYFVGWWAVGILGIFALVSIILFIMGVTKVFEAKLTGAALKMMLAMFGLGVVWFLFLPTLVGALIKHLT